MILILGIGHSYRCDDGVGPYVIGVLEMALVSQGLDNIVAKECSGDLTTFMEDFKKANEVIFIDACSSGKEAGYTQVIDYQNEGLPVNWSQSSTHGLGVAEGLELAKALGVLPSKVILYAIEGKEFSQGVGLTPEVKKSAEKVINDLISHFKESQHA